MRLERVTLHRFRCFWHETLVMATGATLLLGPNDSGKSTLIEAIRALFVDADRFGTPFDWATVMSRPINSAAERWELPPVLDNGGAEEDGEEDERSPGAQAWVLGEFVDLTEDERRLWAPVSSDGALRLGALFASTAGRSGRCLVIDEDSPVGAALAKTLDALDDDAWSEQEPESEDEVRGRGEAADEASVDVGSLVAEWVRFRRDGRIWFDLQLVPWLVLLFGPTVAPMWPGPSLFNVPSDRNLVTFPGPELEPPSADRLLRKLIVEGALNGLSRATTGVEETALDSLWDRLAPLREAVDGAQDRVGEAYAVALEKYLGAPAQTARKNMWEPALRDLGLDQPMKLARARRMLEAAVHQPPVLVAQSLGTGGGGARESGAVPLDRLGAGARRRAALATIELYRDPTIWPTDHFALLLIEEPESGLDPAAQRRVAEALRGLPTYGIQVVLVSHSPVMIGASDPAGWRLVRAGLGPLRGRDRWPQHRAVAPDGLQEIARELGARPSDVLLARRFVVVEGPSDVQAFDIWARRLGSPLADHGVRLVAAGGHGNAAQVGRFLALVYAGAEVLVVLDNGSETQKTKLEIEARYSVPVQLLARTEIEAYYAPTAVVSWWVLQGANLDPVQQQVVSDEFASDPSKRRLRELASKYLARQYDLVNDGLGIVNLMPEREIPAEIKEIINRLVGE